MKARSVFFLCVFLSFTSLARVAAQDFSGGLILGATAAQIDGDSYSGFNKLGTTAGVYVSHALFPGIGWQMEIRYSSRGVYKVPDKQQAGLYRAAYHYLELPLSLHYIHDEKIQIELGLAPDVFLFSAYWDENGLLDPASYPQNRRFGLNAFGGLSYWFRPKLGAAVRYSYSVFPFREPQEWNHPRYRGYYHNVVSLNLAYRFLNW